MDDLVNVKKDLIIEDDNVEVIQYGKILNITPSTPNIDFKGILNKICQYIDIYAVLDKVQKGVEYVVEIPAEFQKGFDAGEYWIMENSKTGKQWPTLMELGENGKQKIVTPLGVKKQEFIQGNPTKDITGHYHNLYMQQQLNELSGLLETTLDAVKRIEHGQMDDRIALMEAGRQGVILALSQKDDASRSVALQNAISNINVAQNKFIETFKRRINEFEELPKTQIGQFFKELGKTGYIEGKIDDYNELLEYYGLYLQSTKMLAGAYAITGDIENAERVFDLSVERINNIDFSSLKSIEYVVDKEQIDKIYEDAQAFLIEEKKICLEEAKEYDCLSIKISGSELLEVLEDGETKTISEQKVEEIK